MGASPCGVPGAKDWGQLTFGPTVMMESSGPTTRGHDRLVWAPPFEDGGDPQAIGVAAGLDDVGAEREAVDDRGGEAGVGEGLAPFREGCVGGDCHGCPLLTLGEDLEEQFGSARVEVDVAELVEAEQIEPAVAGDQARERALV